LNDVGVLFKKIINFPTTYKFIKLYLLKKIKKKLIITKMKKSLLIASVIFLSINLNAQNYLISFTAGGIATSYDSVKVINLAQCTELTLSPADTLNLVGTVGFEQANQNKNGLIVYPNPAYEKTQIQFYNSQKGIVNIDVIDINGRLIINHNSIMEKGHLGFILAGLSNNNYFIHIKTTTESFSQQVLFFNNDNTQPSILQTSTDDITTNCTIKSIKSLQLMAYNNGEELLFIGYSGTLPPVVKHFIPNSDILITFDFVSQSITGASSTCQGAAQNFSTPNINGINNYNWILPTGATITSGSNTSNVMINIGNQTPSGSSNISVVLSSVCGIVVTYYLPITINEAPIANATNSGSVCEGGSITLQTPNVPNATYAWSGPNNWNSTNNAPILSNATTSMGGTYTVTVTSNGCTSTSSTQVTVNTIVATHYGAGFGACIGGQPDVFIEWGVHINCPAPNNINYSFDILYTTTGMGQLSYTVYGIINQGSTYHDSGYCQIERPECYPYGCTVISSSNLQMW